MFDRIAHRYDFLNRVLSMGIDVGWRRKMAAFLPGRGKQHVLDLATGTGDQLLALCAATDRVERGVGLDMAEKMLAIGRRKIARAGLDHKLTLAAGDAGDIPFPAESFDAVTITFGIRNLEDVEYALKEMWRVLKKGGRVLILEFSLPENGVMRGVYLLYLRRILPAVGGWVSGDRKAYRYLNRTVEQFPYGEAFCRLLRHAGFVAVRQHPLTWGIASIYTGTKNEV